MTAIDNVLLNAFQFNPSGVSEGYLAARWHRALSGHCRVDVITAEGEAGEGVNVPSRKWNPRNSFFRRLNSAFKFDYFRFDAASRRKYRDLVRDYDVFHHIVPQAPRYPVSLGRFANRFVIGPVGGCLRVPPAFRKEVEGSEEFYFRARAIDAWRLKHDRILARTFDSADAIVVAGEYVRNVLPERMHGKFHHILDVGVDVGQYPFHERRLDGDVLELAWVGRVVPYKGLIYLLRALAGLSREERRRVHLSVVGNRGDTDYERACQRFVATENLCPTVTFRGYLSREEAAKTLAGSHLFCFPSLAEAGGAAVIEALSTGLPVIAANLGGPAESVTPWCGAKVEADSPDQLEQGLREAILDFAERRRALPEASRAARLRAEQEYDWAVKAEKMMSVYRSVS